MKQSHSSEADSRSASKEVPYTSLNENVHYCVHKRPCVTFRYILSAGRIHIYRSSCLKVWDYFIT